VEIQAIVKDFKDVDVEKETLLAFLRIDYLLVDCIFNIIWNKFNYNQKVHYSKAASRKLFHSVGVFLSISIANYFILWFIYSIVFKLTPS